MLIARGLIKYIGSDLIGTRYTHTFHPESSPNPRPAVFHSKYVNSSSGTGLVHSAPAHGYEDYQALEESGLLPPALRSPIDDAGCFTSNVTEWSHIDMTSQLVGREALGEGVDIMIKILRAERSLLAEQSIEHRYPCDWKTNQPIIVR